MSFFSDKSEIFVMYLWHQSTAQAAFLTRDVYFNSPSPGWWEMRIAQLFPSCLPPLPLSSFSFFSFLLFSTKIKGLEKVSGHAVLTCMLSILTTCPKTVNLVPVAELAWFYIQLIRLEYLQSIDFSNFVSTKKTSWLISYAQWKRPRQNKEETVNWWIVLIVPPDLDWIISWNINILANSEVWLI